MAGALAGGSFGAAVGDVASGGSNQAGDLPGLETARADFSRALGKVKAAHDYLHETFDPEVFACRARVLSDEVGDLASTAFMLQRAAFDAAKK